MTIEAVGTWLIAGGVILALVLGLPLVIGIARLDASNKRLLEYAAQLASRSGRFPAKEAAATVWTASGGRRGAPVVLRPARLAEWGSTIPSADLTDNRPRQLTISPSES